MGTKTNNEKSLNMSTYFKYEKENDVDIIKEIPLFDFPIFKRLHVHLIVFETGAVPYLFKAKVFSQCHTS